jgi:hypothetical protein
MTRWLLRLLVLVGLAVVAWKVWQLLQEDEDHSHDWVAAARQPLERPLEAREPWVKPIGSGCPPGYPVKAKTGSRVFRVPGMFSYEESKPERCYCDEGAAVADGFTRAKR